MYLRLLFNFYIWTLKKEGKNLLERVVLRCLKYSVIMYIIIPLVLLFTQLMIHYRTLDELSWFTIPFEYFYFSLLLTLVIAFIVEVKIPQNITKKVEKAYSQIGGLMARVEW